MKPERTIPAKWHMTYNGFFKRKSITCRVPFFYFDAIKGNDRSSASAVCLMKTVKILSCRIVVKFDTLIRDYCFFMLTFVSSTYLIN